MSSKRIRREVETLKGLVYYRLAQSQGKPSNLGTSFLSLCDCYIMAREGHCCALQYIGGGKPILYYGLNRNIVVSLGKEINRDPVSSGERTQDSLVIEMYYLILWNG